MKQLFALTALLAACGGSSDTSSTTVDAATSPVDGAVSPVDCTTATAGMAKAVCQATGFLGTLDSTELATVNLAIDANAARTQWSNLPGVTRAGIEMSALTATQQAAALALMASVLSTDGYADLTGVRNADDYLNSVGGAGGGGGPGGGAYGAGNYSIAIFGTPSATGHWEVMFGGHHMAYNILFNNGVGYPVPNHLGVEPKASFTINGGTFQPMADEGAAMVAVFSSLTSTQLASSYLSGQTFSDVVIGPAEYGTGSSALAKAKFPTGANRKGVLVSSLTTAQQAQVTEAITQWAGDYDSSISDSLISAYTSSTAYADTYVAWGGTQAAGVDVDVDGTYMRIDGPRVWIEVACQAGVVIQGITHYHSIYRDKTFDYGGDL